MQTEVKDEELAALAQKGDKAAVEKLLNRYKNAVLSVARGFFLSGGQTEDLVQEGMCGLYSAILSYTPDKSGFSTYALHCIRNRIIDTVKVYSSNKNLPLNNFVPMSGIEDTGGAEGPDDELIKQENRREFLQKISGILSSFEFKVIVMYMDGLTLAEIASSTGKPAKSIDNALQRAKRKLQKIFNRHGG